MGVALRVCLAGCLTLLPVGVKADNALFITFGTNVISEAQVIGATRATVGINATLTNALTVTIRNQDPTQVSVPASVSIPAGSNTAAFNVDAVNNGDLDGTRSVTIMVDADGFVAASATLQITDDDTPTHRTIGGRLFGHLSTNTYWVTANLTVETNRTLTIDPLSTLLFASGTGLTNAGTLLAAGNLGAEIRFASALPNPTNGSWEGLTFTSSGAAQTVLDHVEIAFAQTGVLVVPSASQPSFLLTNSAIHHCSLDGVGVHADHLITIDFPAVQLVSNQIYQNSRHGVNIYAYVYGCELSRNSASVVGNDIFQNLSAGVHLNADASRSSGCPAIRRSRVSSLVANNSIHGNKYGIYGYARKGLLKSIGSLYPTIQNNLILNNTLDGVWLDAGVGTHAVAELYPSVVNNTIVRNGGAGILHGTNTTIGFLIENNLVVENNYGILASAVFADSNAAVACNDVWANALSNWINYPSGYGALTTNNLNGTPADPKMNISADPLFAGLEDFRLQPTSPAVDAGSTNRAPTTDSKGQNRVMFPDIGYDEVVQPLLTIASSLDSPGFQLSLTSGRGYQYSIESTTDFQTWVTVVTNVTMTNRTVSVRLPSASGERCRFYRATLQP